MSRLAIPLSALFALAFVAPVSAANPPTSSLTVPTTVGAAVTRTWTGTAPGGVNPASSCALVDGTPVADTHATTISVAAGTYDQVSATFTFTASWTPAGDEVLNDLILTVLDPSGKEVASSDTSSTTETVVANNLAAGTYHAVVCGFNNTSTQAYSGSVKVTTAAVGSAPAPNILPAAGTHWTTPVKVTPDNGYGYEPSFIVDSYGNAFATAHKENWQLALAPDPNSPTYTRSMSWAWLSTNKGATWSNTPGLTRAAIDQHQVGDEGDMTQDDAGHVYFADTYAADITLTRWTTNGLGKVTWDFSRPIVPTPEDDDRPWVIAHGNGHVFYFSNAGNKTINGGRYTVHASYDGGLTFDSVGVGLPDSGWCRPAADHRPGSKLVYAACTNDNGRLYIYTSRDDGHTFTRYPMGIYNNDDGTQSWPTIQIGPNGDLWVLYVDAAKVDENGIPISNYLFLYHSTNQGQTWTRQNVTPVAGRYQYAWLSLSNDGTKLGYGVYYRPNSDFSWNVAAVTWNVNSWLDRRTFYNLDPKHPVSPMENDEPPGDYMGSYFFPDGKLGVIWTRYSLWASGVTTLYRDIYFARQQ